MGRSPLVTRNLLIGMEPVGDNVTECMGGPDAYRAQIAWCPFPGEPSELVADLTVVAATWERKLNEISKASVTVPANPDCCDQLIFTRQRVRRSCTKFTFTVTHGLIFWLDGYWKCRRTRRCRLTFRICGTVRRRATRVGKQPCVPLRLWRGSQGVTTIMGVHRTNNDMG